MNFIERMLLLIKKKGVTRNKLLKDLNLGAGTFDGWVKNGNIPNGDTIIKLAQYFNVSSDYLLGIETPPDNNQPKLRDDESSLLENYNTLNIAGQKALFECSQLLLGSDKYYGS